MVTAARAEPSLLPGPLSPAEGPSCTPGGGTESWKGEEAEREKGGSAGPTILPHAHRPEMGDAEHELGCPPAWQQGVKA